MRGAVDKLMKTLHEFLDLMAFWWHRICTSRYTLHLEQEIHQLREEKAALLQQLMVATGTRPVMQPRIQASAPMVQNKPEGEPAKKPPMAKVVPRDLVLPE